MQTFTIDISRLWGSKVDNRCGKKTFSCSRGSKAFNFNCKVWLNNGKCLQTSLHRRYVVSLRAAEDWSVTHCVELLLDMAGSVSGFKKIVKKISRTEFKIMLATRTQKSNFMLKITKSCFNTCFDYFLICVVEHRVNSVVGLNNNRAFWRCTPSFNKDVCNLLKCFFVKLVFGVKPNVLQLTFLKDSELSLSYSRFGVA